MGELAHTRILLVLLHYYYYYYDYKIYYFIIIKTKSLKWGFYCAAQATLKPLRPDWAVKNKKIVF